MDGCTQNVPDSLNTAQYQRSCDACDPCSTPSPPPTPTLPTDQYRDDSTFNVLLLKAKGIGNKLTELGVVIGDTSVKAHTKIQEPLHPELHHSS